MRVTGYAYPWDVLDAPGFTERAEELGVDEVAVAVSYHSTRAATPWSPSRSSVVARHAAFYRPIRESAWGRLRPAEPDWAGAEDSAGDAVRALGKAGIPAAAWVVFTHNSLLGTKHPEVAVRNCFGEVYPWALCPAREEVREYAAKVAAESVRGLEFRSVILEACGPLGVVHQHQHEKTDGVWSPAAARVLSICCCAACAAQWDGDTGEIQAALAAEARRLIASGDLGATEDNLSPEVKATVLAGRQRSVDALRAGILAEIGAGPRLVLHGALDPWVTGALPGLTPGAPDDVHSVVLQCWAPGQVSVDAVAAARATLPSNVDVGAYVTAVAASPVPEIDRYTAELAKAGAGELHLYHLGLAGAGRWADLAAAVRGARTVN
ncbi:hypothetical protein [Amycolatopsis albispora]|uniref:Alanine-rich protein n=1 Tax=Amycolatopsis albispora TaxID=1804986 RepID=A0A344L6W0_9PSEU|nr:hypothetical protein [Amycolatopsis albispora]AXB43784.1 hypothetical protein A4R43_15675 [Amycolatopsis albispora]